MNTVRSDAAANVESSLPHENEAESKHSRIRSVLYIAAIIIIAVIGAIGAGLTFLETQSTTSPADNNQASTPTPTISITK